MGITCAEITCYDASVVLRFVELHIVTGISAMEHLQSSNYTLLMWRYLRWCCYLWLSGMHITMTSKLITSKHSTLACHGQQVTSQAYITHAQNIQKVANLRCSNIIRSVIQREPPNKDWIEILSQEMVEVMKTNVRHILMIVSWCNHMECWAIFALPGWKLLMSWTELGEWVSKR